MNACIHWLTLIASTQVLLYIDRVVVLIRLRNALKNYQEPGQARPGFLFELQKGFSCQKTNEI
jgi:hypothetical protein